MVEKLLTASVTVWTLPIEEGPAFMKHCKLGSDVKIVSKYILTRSYRRILYNTQVKNKLKRVDRCSPNVAVVRFITVSPQGSVQVLAQIGGRALREVQRPESTTSGDPGQCLHMEVNNKRTTMKCTWSKFSIPRFILNPNFH